MKRFLFGLVAVALFFASGANASIIRMDWRGTVALNTFTTSGIGPVGVSVTGFVTYDDSRPLNPIYSEYHDAILNWEVGPVLRANFTAPFPDAIDAITVGDNSLGGASYDYLQMTDSRNSADETTVRNFSIYVDSNGATHPTVMLTSRNLTDLVDIDFAQAKNTRVWLNETTLGEFRSSQDVIVFISDIEFTVVSGGEPEPPGVSEPSTLAIFAGALVALTLIGRLARRQRSLA